MAEVVGAVRDAFGITTSNKTEQAEFPETYDAVRQTPGPAIMNYYNSNKLRLTALKARIVRHEATTRSGLLWLMVVAVMALVSLALCVGNL